MGIEKSELVLKVLPYLDPHNQFFDDEPYPLGSNCVPQLVLRAIFLFVLLCYVHATFGASRKFNGLLLVSDDTTRMSKRQKNNWPSGLRSIDNCVAKSENSTTETRQNAEDGVAV